MKHDIFVSYARNDEKVVIEFVDMLEKQGYKVWFDRDIVHGKSFPKEIAKAIDESSMVLFFSSSSSNASKWVTREVIYADTFDKPIIPVLLDTSEYNPNFKLMFSGVEHVDASAGYMAAKDELLVAVGREIGQRNAGVCPAIGKACPESAVLDIDQSMKAGAGTGDGNGEAVVRAHLRSEALLFSAICTFVWIAVLALCGILADIMHVSYWTVLLVSAAFLLDIYSTCITTNSKYVPGWYNRNLTTYGAMILTLDGFIVALAVSLSAVIGTFGVVQLLLVVTSVLGVVAVTLLFAQKKAGYVLMWVTGVVLSVSAALIPSSLIGKIVTSCVVVLIYSLMMLVFDTTLKLNQNGTSTWCIIFGRQREESRGFRVVESALLRLWFKIYK